MRGGRGFSPRLSGGTGPIGGAATMQPTQGVLLLGALIAALAAPPAHSRQNDDASEPTKLGPFALAFEADADFLLALGGDEAREDAPFADIALRLNAEAIRRDGVRYGLRVEQRVQRDNGRRGLARAVAGANTAPGLLTGLSRGSFDPAGARARLESAELFLKHAWVEAALGRGPGAGAREAIALPGAFRLMRADGAPVDSTGLLFADTLDRLSGSALKISVQSRRLAGFRASASFAPQADICGVDACSAGAGVSEHVAEFAVSFDRRLRRSGVRWAGSASASRGEASPRVRAPVAPGVLADPYAVAIRALREQGGLAVALGWLRSNDGLAQGRYEALSASASYEAGDWLFALEAAHAQAEPSGVDGWSAQIGASRILGDGALVGVGLVHAEEDARSGPSRRATQLFVETGLRF